MTLVLPNEAEATEADEVPPAEEAIVFNVAAGVKTGAPGVGVVDEDGMEATETTGGAATTTNKHHKDLTTKKTTKISQTIPLCVTDVALKATSNAIVEHLHTLFNYTRKASVQTSLNHTVHSLKLPLFSQKYTSPLNTN